MQPRTLFSIFALVAFVVAGCDRPANPVVPVKGKVVFIDGTPLPEGTRLHFNPVEGDRDSASATTSKDGSFELEHIKGDDGAEIGSYMISVLAPEGKEAQFAKIVPEAYMDGDILKAEVKEGMGPLELKVKRLVGN